MLPIAVQELYVLLRQGKIEDAQSLLDEISIDEYVDFKPGLVAVTSLTCDAQHPRTVHEENRSEQYQPGTPYWCQSLPSLQGPTEHINLHR